MSRYVGYALLAGLAAVLLMTGGTVSVGVGKLDRYRDSAHSDGPERAFPAQGGDWVGSWSATPTGPEPGNEYGLSGQSVRNVVRTSIGGSILRVELSNRYGERPVTFTGATVALAAAKGPAARPGSMRELTFGGSPSVRVPAGGTVFSDAVTLEVPPATNVLISVYAPRPAGRVTYHRMAQQVSYLAFGDRTADLSGRPYVEAGTHWRYVMGLQVRSQTAEGAVVVLGDSLTDGITSTPGTNQRWTDFLAVRLREEPDVPRCAVLNQGVSGNRVLRHADLDRPFNGPSGRRRLYTDVLPQAGARTVVVQLGINDIIKPPRQLDPRAITAGLRAIADDARAHGLWVAGATLAPFAGHLTHSVELEAVRQRVNTEIRAGRVFDVVIDFDAALRDPNQPDRLLPRYDSGDGLHPSDAGYRAMADAVDLRALLPEPATVL